MAYSYYAVRRGRETGIFTDWKECQKQIARFPNASFKGFVSKEEAEAWLNPIQSFNDEEADYVIYTDGSCLSNPNGKGGYAAIIEYDGTTQEIVGHELSTTNNRMELMAAIKALEATKENSRISLHTDSTYLQKAFAEKWIENWKRNRWKNANRQHVLNKDLWVRLDELVSKRVVVFQWVKGHFGDVKNERCDKLAYNAALNQ